MLWVPQKGVVNQITNSGIVGSATPGTGVPSNATTLLDGAVTEIISAANNVQDSWGIYIMITATSLAATASEACMDILIGGATDDVLIPALICGYQNINQSWATYLFPLHIPGGVRIAASLASVRVSITSQVVITLLGGSPPPWRCGSRVTTYGTQINNARGKAVTPAQSGAAASVTEMTASTSEDHFAFMPGFQPATDVSITAVNHNIGIGVGAATEERMLGASWWYMSFTTELFPGPLPCFPAFYDVPAASRLSLLASNSSTNDAAFDGLIYAVS